MTPTRQNPFRRGGRGMAPSPQVADVRFVSRGPGDSDPPWLLSVRFQASEGDWRGGPQWQPDPGFQTERFDTKTAAVKARAKLIKKTGIGVGVTGERTWGEDPPEKNPRRNPQQKRNHHLPVGQHVRRSDGSKVGVVVQQLRDDWYYVQWAPGRIEADLGHNLVPVRPNPLASYKGVPYVSKAGVWTLLQDPATGERVARSFTGLHARRDLESFVDVALSSSARVANPRRKNGLVSSAKAKILRGLEWRLPMLEALSAVQPELMPLVTVLRAAKRRLELGETPTPTEVKALAKAATATKAVQNPRRKNPVGTVRGFLATLTHELVRYDMRMQRKQPNAYRLGHLLGAANEVGADMSGHLESKDPAVMAALKRSIARRFTLPFAPASAVIKMIDAFLATGKEPTLRKNPKGRTKVQSLLFPKGSFTAASAASWAKAHKFKAPKVETAKGYLRIRQAPPASFKAKSFRTVKFGNGGIMAVVGVPRP